MDRYRNNIQGCKSEYKIDTLRLLLGAKRLRSTILVESIGRMLHCCLGAETSKLLLDEFLKLQVAQ
jgi:hypothetical protein